MNQNPYQENQNKPVANVNFADTIVNIVVKILPILIIVFVGIGATSMLYYFVGGLANAFGLYGSFGSLITYTATGISTLAKYCFYAVVTAGIYKLIKK